MSRRVVFSIVLASMVVAGITSKGAIIMSGTSTVSESTTPPSAQALPYAADQVLRLYRGGTTKDLIISYVGSSSIPFHLTADSILNLQSAGLPQDIIQAMIVRDGQLQQQNAAYVWQQQQQQMEAAAAAQEQAAQEQAAQEQAAQEQAAQEQAAQEQQGQDEGAATSTTPPPDMSDAGLNYSAYGSPNYGGYGWGNPSFGFGVGIGYPSFGFYGRPGWGGFRGCGNRGFCGAGFRGGGFHGFCGGHGGGGGHR